MSTSTKKQAYWTEQCRKWESSGLTQQQFCEQQGLKYKQFIYWRWFLNKGNIEGSEPKLIKVSTTPSLLKCHTMAAPDSGLEVILPTGIKLYIRAAADITRASALIQLLGGAQ